MSEVTNSIMALTVLGGDAAQGKPELLLLGRHYLLARKKKREKCFVNSKGGQIRHFQIQMAGGGILEDRKGMRK